jgi:alkanesulfonate monooxygenase SsuD/methylene tetrahydromethanopterin reductase-like flavin-dependent oxidoreductase (luciferase family)
VFPLCGALTEATNTITIGTSLALAPFYEPIRLAEDAAVVDLLSGGRFRMGLGIGYRDWEFEQFGVAKKDRVGHIIDCVRVCKRAWSGEYFSYDGHVFQYDEARVTPTPAQGTELPVFIGSYAERGVRRAARIADGYIAGGDSKEVVERQFGWVTEEADEAFPTYVLRDAFVGNSREDAWETMKPGITHTKETYAEWFEASSDEFSRADDPESKWKAEALFGSPDELTEQLLEYDELLGEDDHLILRLDHPGLSYDTLANAVETIGQEVIPRVTASQ